MEMTKRTGRTRALTLDDYYNERFLRLETELSHQRELIKMGFETMDRRLLDLRTEMNARFETMDRRFEAMNVRIDRFMKWSFGMTLSSTGIIIAAMKLWN